MDIAVFLTAAKAYPPPQNPDGTQMRFSYGTAGFRTVGTTLNSTVFRSGALAAVRSRVTGRACGIVITASHNPEFDNGIKLVDCTGGMLPTSWEADAESLANAESDDEMKRVLEKLLALDEPAESLHPPPPPGLDAGNIPYVFLARDTRPTGPELAKAALAGAKAAGATVDDLGLNTTPQGHFAVYASYRGAPNTEEAYYKRLAQGYASLLKEDGDHDDSSPVEPIFVDCANGVGAGKFTKLINAVEETGVSIPIKLHNHEGTPGTLNNQVGADYVQKEQKPPKFGGFDALPSNAKCVSIDGDADRLVYFYTDENKKTTLLDGDKIAALVATHVSGLLKRCGESLLDPVTKKPLDVGVVQTAYANGASTKYIEQVLKMKTKCTPTGVKWLHPAAEAFDVGVYFEANGHGTALFSETAIDRIRTVAENSDGSLPADALRALKSLLALTEAINPAVGDALSGVLVVEAILQAKRWGLRDWNTMYSDLPSKQVKVKVQDRSVITTTDAERRCMTPSGMQQAIDAKVSEFGNDARAFARPSGTEDVVRVYAEAATREWADSLAKEVSKVVYTFAGGTGEAP